MFSTKRNILEAKSSAFPEALRRIQNYRHGWTTHNISRAAKQNARVTRALKNYSEIWVQLWTRIIYWAQWHYCDKIEVCSADKVQDSFAVKYLRIPNSSKARTSFEHSHRRFIAKLYKANTTSFQKNTHKFNPPPLQNTSFTNPSHPAPIADGFILALYNTVSQLAHSILVVLCFKVKLQHYYRI